MRKRTVTTLLLFTVVGPSAIYRGMPEGGFCGSVFPETGPKRILVLLLAALAGFAVLAHAEEDRWWSLQPLKRPLAPDAKGPDASRVESPVDLFVIDKHREKGLRLSPEAGRRTLIRRLYFNLIGLPPSPGEVKRFVNHDDPDAYKKLVDSLLASPHYGERWARHWLDVVHYGESHGYDKDKPRPNAWPYRDYVIRAFNEDRPYARFVKEQLAGDVLWPDTMDGIVATGFIAAGPWDFIGHAEVPEEKIDGKVARHLDRDDMVTTTMNAFCSLTVQCAQCHDHKLDPVTMKDYYSLQSVFAALDRADRPYDVGPEVAANRAALKEEETKLQDELTKTRKELEALKTPEVIALDKEIAALNEKLGVATKTGGERSNRYGYHSQVAGSQDTVKWVQIDLGQARRLDKIVLMGAVEYGFPDFGFPHRFRVESSNKADFSESAIIADHSQADYPRPGARPVTFDGKDSVARYVRVTATKLWSRRQKGQQKTNDWIFALGEMAVVSESTLAKVKTVTALDSIEAPPRWAKADLIDGIYGAYPLANLVAAEKSKTNGYHSKFAEKADTPKWVQIDLGKSQQIDRIDLYPARPTDFPDTPGFGFPVRFRVELSPDADFSRAMIFDSKEGSDYPNPGAKVVSLAGLGKKGRYVRLSASKLSKPKGSGGYMLALGEMRVFSTNNVQGKDVLRSADAKVTALDSIDSGRWHRKNLIDGFTSRERIGDAATGLLRLAEAGSKELRTRLEAKTAERNALMAKLARPDLNAREKSLSEQMSKVAAEIKKLAKPQMVYAGTVHKGGGTFKGRGHVGGKPRDIYVLHRGNVTQPGDPVQPATVPGVVKDVPHVFELPKDHKEGARRVALAEWIVHRENALTWRSIVNRVWQYHFGRGIVDTPNDFGRVGDQPSHPELLDWLAVEFRDGGGSLKQLHRLILNSAVYKQSSAQNAAHAKTDDSNRFLWRQNRRRIEAEALRDTVLLVSGKLDRKMGGPSFKDFVIERPEHSPHYQYHKASHDDPATHRRSVYRFIIRSQPQPFMDTLDCADPSQLVDKRGETTTALQALALLNNAFMVRMAEHFALRVGREDDPVATAFELSLSRTATPEELSMLRQFAGKHGLSAMCRLLFNFSEFSFVD